VNKIEWNNSELHEYGFNFLFDKFKEYYLVEIFTDFKKLNIYEPDLGKLSFSCVIVVIDLLWLLVCCHCDEIFLRGACTFNMMLHYVVLLVNYDRHWEIFDVLDNS